MLRLLSASALVAAAVTTAQGGEAASAQARRVEIGKRVYETQCASCHGARAEGAPKWREPDANGEMPAPPHDAQGHTWKHGDGMLYRIVRDGWRDAFNKTQRLTMPPFGDKLSPKEIRAVIEYLKTFWTREQRRFQREESRKAPFPSEADSGPEFSKQRSKTMKYRNIALFISAIGALPPAFAGTPVTLYRNPNCGCCNTYADYLKGNGFDVKLVNTYDMASINKKFGVSETLKGCHTAVIGNYVFEGLVPVEYVKQVVSERRFIKGLSVPGMPSGAPSMPGPKHGAIQVYYLGDSTPPRVFASF